MVQIKDAPWIREAETKGYPVGIGYWDDNEAEETIEDDEDSDEYIEYFSETNEMKFMRRKEENSDEFVCYKTIRFDN